MELEKTVENCSQIYQELLLKKMWEIRDNFYLRFVAAHLAKEMSTFRNNLLLKSL
jgi:hypothetical protein